MLTLTIVCRKCIKRYWRGNMSNFLVVICENRNNKAFNSVLDCMGELGDYSCISKNLYVLSCKPSHNSEYVRKHLMLETNPDILVIKLLNDTDIDWFFKLRKSYIDNKLNELLGR